MSLHINEYLLWVFSRCCEEFKDVHDNIAALGPCLCNLGEDKSENQAHTKGKCAAPCYNIFKNFKLVTTEHKIKLMLF